MSARFEMLLFTAAPSVATAACSGGFDAIVVDLECRGKDARQAGADTEVNCYSPSDEGACRGAASCDVVCRINAVGDWTTTETEAVLAAGADEILVPMVRAAHELERVMRLVAGRARVGVLIETVEALGAASNIASLHPSRVYMGLNDLGIARRTPNIFTALIDGTADTVAEKVAEHGVSFGVAGLTLPDSGAPVPCRLLIAEMSRLGCSHAFMRRSFLRDVPVESFAEGVATIRSAIEAASTRGASAVASDRAEFVAAVAAWDCVQGRARV